MSFFSCLSIVRTALTSVSFTYPLISFRFSLARSAKRYLRGEWNYGYIWCHTPGKCHIRSAQCALEHSWELLIDAVAERKGDTLCRCAFLFWGGGTAPTQPIMTLTPGIQTGSRSWEQGSAVYHIPLFWDGLLSLGACPCIAATFYSGPSG